VLACWALAFQQKPHASRIAAEIVVARIGKSSLVFG
jgi:hypothetical protein